LTALQLSTAILGALRVFCTSYDRNLRIVVAFLHEVANEE